MDRAFVFDVALEVNFMSSAPADSQLIQIRSAYFGAENSCLPMLFDSSPSADHSEWLPLVLYGDSGAGKSYVALHLADLWKDELGEDSVIVTTASDLCRMFVPSRLSNSEQDWSETYRSTSLLVIDDLHKLGGRPLADGWLTAVLDHRINHGLPTICTAPSVDGLAKLSRRLRSRVLAGLCFRVALPTTATRLKIIERFVEETSLELDDRKINSLVSQTDGMSITGIHNTVHAIDRKQLMLTDFSKPNQNDEGESECLSELAASCIRASARRFGVRVSDLKSPSRRKNTVLARSIAMFLIRELCAFSLVEVGKHFQNRDHTTVRHACQKIRKSLSTDKATQDAVRSICVAVQRPVSPTWFEFRSNDCA